MLVVALRPAGSPSRTRTTLEHASDRRPICCSLIVPPMRVTTHDMLMPLFTFVVLGGGAPLTAWMARGHYAIVTALRNLDELEFSAQVPRSLTTFAFRWISLMSAQSADGSRGT